jgi:hypothetical protein
MYPVYNGQWTALCQKPIILGLKGMCMQMIFTGFACEVSKLTAKDRECLSPAKDLWVDTPLSMNQKRELNKEVNGSVNIRTILLETYPNAFCMHKFASWSVQAT